MKNGFVVTSLVLAAGCSGAFAADAFGVFPATISSVVSLPALIGWFAAAGVLAFAFRDYAPPSGSQRRPKRNPGTEPPKSARPTATTDTAWVHHTVSA